ncbi:AlpA family phage regulatory protein [Vibrio parahaemolyticus]|nr:AlpA family phage regulatory protein [Vibrio parahaemolyticus]
MKNKNIIIRQNELIKQLGISKSTLWRWRQAGFIPEPLNLGPRVIAWESYVINEWLESKRYGEVN